MPGARVCSRRSCLAVQLGPVPTSAVAWLAGHARGPTPPLFAASFTQFSSKFTESGKHTRRTLRDLTGVGLGPPTHSGQDFGFRYESGLWLAGWVVLSARP